MSHTPITCTNQPSQQQQQISSTTFTDPLSDTPSTIAVLTRLQTDLSNLSRTGNDLNLLPIIEQLEQLTSSSSSSIDIRSDTRILGAWHIKYTTRPTTASIIQRTAMSSPSFAPIIEQLILGPNLPRYVITRIDLRPIFGCLLNLKASVTNVVANRINIQFDEAWFSFANGKVRLPYPVPFRLLGKKTCGWQDITFLNSKCRVTRGNKGTVFVLQHVPMTEALSVTDDLKKACPDIVFN